MAESPSTIPMSDEELEALLAEPPKWPKVIGILSIIWGAIGITCLGGSFASSFFFRPMMEQVVQQQGGEGLPPNMDVGAMQYALLAVGLVLAGMLFAAGIMTLSRKPVGRMLHLVYAILAIIYTFWSSVVSIQQQNEMGVWVEANPDHPFAQGQNPILNLVMMAAGVLVSLAWPLFCVIWFTLSERGKSDMKGTGLETAA